MRLWISYSIRSRRSGDTISKRIMKQIVCPRKQAGGLSRKQVDRRFFDIRQTGHLSSERRHAPGHPSTFPHRWSRCRWRCRQGISLSLPYTRQSRDSRVVLACHTKHFDIGSGCPSGRTQGRHVALGVGQSQCSSASAFLMWAVLTSGRSSSHAFRSLAVGKGCHHRRVGRSLRSPRG